MLCFCFLCMTMSLLSLKSIVSFWNALQVKQCGNYRAPFCCWQTWKCSTDDTAWHFSGNITRTWLIIIDEITVIFYIIPNSLYHCCYRLRFSSILTKTKKLKYTCKLQNRVYLCNSARHILVKLTSTGPLPITEKDQ